MTLSITIEKKLSQTNTILNWRSQNIFTGIVFLNIYSLCCMLLKKYLLHKALNMQNHFRIQQEYFEIEV